jgi:hydrogenase 3 maturation protease
MPIRPRRAKRRAQRRPPSRPRPRRLRPAEPAFPREELHRRLGAAGPVAVIGIGSELHGDDAAGVLVARKLGARRAAPAGRLRAFEAGGAPENVTGDLIRFLGSGAGPGRPHVLLVDAANLDLAAGQMKLLAPEDLDGISCSTHRLPLGVLGRYLAERSGCQVSVLGIQPKSVSFLAPVSPEVRRAVTLVAAELRSLLGRAPRAAGKKRAP